MALLPMLCVRVFESQLNLLTKYATSSHCSFELLFYRTRALQSHKFILSSFSKRISNHQLSNLAGTIDILDKTFVKVAAKYLDTWAKFFGRSKWPSHTA